MGNKSKFPQSQKNLQIFRRASALLQDDKRGEEKHVFLEAVYGRRICQEPCRPIGNSIEAPDLSSGYRPPLRCQGWRVPRMTGGTLRFLNDSRGRGTLHNDRCHELALVRHHLIICINVIFRLSLTIKHNTQSVGLKN